MNSGVFETSGEDFSNGDEVFDAIGGILQEVAIDKSEDDIRQVSPINQLISLKVNFGIHPRELCSRLVSILRESTVNGFDSKSTGVTRILNAPVHLGSMVASNEIDSAANSIWIHKTDDFMVALIPAFKI